MLNFSFPDHLDYSLKARAICRRLAGDSGITIYAAQFQVIQLAIEFCFLGLHLH
jgi:hypothetical protein